MEPVTTQQPDGSFFSRFKPIGGNHTPPVTGQQSAPGNEPGATPQPGGSGVPGGGTIGQDQLFSDLKHTEMSSVSGSGGPGQSGTGSANGGASVSLGGMVQGEWVVNLMDAIIPAGIVAAFYYFDVKLRKSEMQLTQAEKNTLSPLVQKCLDTMLLNFNNPWNALIISLVVIYGGKAAEKGIVAYIDKSQDKKQQEALTEKQKASAVTEDPARFDPANQSLADLQTGKVSNLTDEIPEEEIRAKMKKWRMGRDKVVERLKKQRAA